jgi:hypothetical protein
VVGYDGGQDLRDEERRLNQESGWKPWRPPPRRKRILPEWLGFRGKTFWDWLELLVVPLALLGIGYFFSVQQNARLQRTENQRVQEAQKIENQRAEAEQELAEQRAQDEALQAYLNQMSDLLLEKDLRSSEEDSEVRTLARARTTTVLVRLDPKRKPAVIGFLIEAKLIQRVAGREPIINLGGADLSGANLRVADLGGANLTGVDLSDAELSEAYLSGADLRIANLSGANLQLADLSEAILLMANLSEAKLSGATMPNGQKSEEWLKDREKRQQDE